MRSIRHTSGGHAAKILHIETDGAIINITVGLTDRHRRRVTRVEIIPMDESRAPDAQGRYWHLDGGRLIQATAPSLTRRTGPTTGPRIMAILDRHVWDGDDMHDVGDGVPFDITEAIQAMPAHEARASRDGQGTADDLYEWAIAEGRLQRWEGPFTIRAQAAIATYLQR